jgi:hypothetical protein
MHVEQVLGDVPREERCHCRETTSAGNETKEPAGFLRRFFGV